MEKRLNKKIDTYVTSFKDNIKEKASQIGLMKNDQMNQLIQYIYDYEKLFLTKEDFMKRKRIKNVVPFYDRCCAKRANNEQCTRRKKIPTDQYCGTHLKGTPHGIMETSIESKPNTEKKEVWAQDIQGILYYIDNNHNVYQAEDIIINKMDPKIIAKYVKKEDVYSIPEFGI
jgi:hypothetical protein